MSETKTEIAIVNKEELSLIKDNNLNERQLAFILKRTPATYVHQRPAKGGGTWSYVTGGYIKKVLNLMFGWDWDFEVVSSEVLHGQIVILGKLTCRAGGKTIMKMQYGCKDIAYRKGTKIPLDVGNDFKAASTDALKKCASEIGIAADIYNGQEFREVRVASEEKVVTGESEKITKGVEDAMKKAKGDKTEEVEVVDEAVENVAETASEDTTEEVVEEVVAETPEITTTEGEVQPVTPVPEEEPKPQKEESEEPPMTSDQREAIMELLKADDFPEGYVDDVVAELDDFDNDRANACINWLSAKKYLPKSKEWKPEWELYGEEYLKSLGTGMLILKITADRHIERPKNKVRTNKLLRDLILGHQKENAPKDALVHKYEPPTEEPEPEKKASEEEEPVVEANVVEDAPQDEPETEVPAEQSESEQPEPTTDVTEEEPATEETKSEPTPTPEKVSGLSVEAFKVELSEIEKPLNNKGRDFVPLKKVWNLLGKYGVTNENTADTLKKMELSDNFSTKEDFCRDATDEQLTEFIKHFAK